MDMVRIIAQQFPVETFFEAADWLLQNVENTQTLKQSGKKHI